VILGGDFLDQNQNLGIKGWGFSIWDWGFVVLDLGFGIGDCGFIDDAALYRFYNKRTADY